MARHARRKDSRSEQYTNPDDVFENLHGGVLAVKRNRFHLMERAMSCEKELKEIVEDLIKGPSPWFKGNGYYISALQAIIRDGGKCVYCGKDLWETYGAPACVDHLLPRSVYPDRAAEVD